MRGAWVRREVVEEEAIGRMTMGAALRNNMVLMFL